MRARHWLVLKWWRNPKRSKWRTIMTQTLEATVERTEGVSRMTRVYNFSPGPAVLPEDVLKQAQGEFLDWRGSGMSVMEMSHRGKEFIAIAEKAEADLRELLAIPPNYKVLFLQGGATGQFAAVPMNLLRGKTSA